MKMPELLAPAGNFEKLRFALGFGADAVYCGVPFLSMRARENQFDQNSLRQAVKYCRLKKKKIYFTVNIYPHNDKISAFKTVFRKIVRLNPDAFIVSDPGMIDFIRENFPAVELHLSVQQNTINYLSAAFWKKQGIKRIILSKELSIDEIKEIIKQNTKLDFEIFIHGSICIAHSGRCLLSNFLTHRDANQGVCAHSCRWRYKVYEKIGKKRLIDLGEKEYFLEEEKRPGEFLKIDEDENGSFIMSSRDICSLEVLNRIIKTGVKSLKIEGRSKTVYYLAIICRCYRHALDRLKEGRPVNVKGLFDEVFSTCNRGFIPGFFEGDLGEKTIEYHERESSSTHDFAGIVKNFNKIEDHIEIEPKNRFQKNDQLEFCFPDKRKDFRIKVKEMILNDEEKVEVAHGGDKNVFLKIPSRHFNKFKDKEIFCIIRKRKSDL